MMFYKQKRRRAQENYDVSVSGIRMDTDGESDIFAEYAFMAGVIG